MRRQRTSKRRPPFRTVLLLEWLEERTLLSTMDGSFGAVMLSNLRSDPAFTSINGNGIGIAVIDTGVFAQHPDLQANFVHWYDAVTDQDSSYTSPSLAIAASFDPVGHGTHVAGIAASADPNIGVAPSAELIGIRAVPQPGEPVAGNRDPIVAALQWVIAHHQDFNIRVVNLSVGTDSNVNAPSTTVAETGLIVQLQALGIAVVSASGNAYADFLAPGVSELAAASTLAVASTWATAGQFPAQVSGTGDGGFLTVERSSAVDRVAASSQRSALPSQVAAPGQNIISAWNGAGGLLHNTLSGTSMAAPLVSGAIALMQQAAYAFGGRYLDTGQVVSILRSTADTITDSTVTDNGRIPSANGTADWTQEAPLTETGLSLKRINIHRAVQSVQQLMTGGTGGGGGGNGADRSNTTGNAVHLPPLYGTNEISAGGSIGQDGQIQIGAADIDLYQVNVIAPGTLTVQIGAVVGSSATNVFVRVFDANGNQIAAEDTGPDGQATLTTGELQPGTYYVGVSGTGNVTYNIINGTGAVASAVEGDYTLTIRLDSADPDGTLAGAVPFTGLPTSDQGDIGADPDNASIGASDVDIYRVVAPDDGTLTIMLNGFAYGDEAAQTYLRVFDAFGDELGGGLTGVFGSMSLQLSRGQTVFVAVSDVSNIGYDPVDLTARSAAGQGGKYDLNLTFENGDADGTVFRGLPLGPGAVLEAYVGLDFSGIGTYTVGADGSKDVDWYFFQADSTAYADFRATGHGGFVPSLSLWEIDTQQSLFGKVAESVQTDAQLIFPIEFGRSYYLAVTGRGNSGFSHIAVATGTGGETGAYTIAYDNVFAPPGGGPGLPHLGDLVIGAPTSGNLGMQGNQVVGAAAFDLYRFVAGATQSIAIRTETSAEGSSNTFLRFFDAAGTELAFNDNQNSSTTASQLNVLVQAGQTYYIGVSGAGANPRGYDPVTGQGASPGSTGTYTLNLSGQPIVTVTALPAFSGANFMLSWSGQPGANGPSIVSYDVFVSDNGGPATPSLKGTTQTSTPFQGQTGHTYSFSVIATDRFGNRSAVTAAAQTATRVDTTPPLSTVAVLPTYSGTSFQLAWSGVDDPGGSGLAFFDVFVSDEGAPFVPLLLGTTRTSIAFEGFEGHDYAFYSVGVDARGNRQATPTAGQATTHVDTVAPISSVTFLPAQSPSDFRVSWTGVDEGTSGIAGFDIYVSIDGGPFQLFLAGTRETSAPFHGEEGHTYAFYSVATDEVGNRQPLPAGAQATTLVPLHIYVTSAEAGGGPDIKVFDADTGDLRFEFFAFDPRFTGGVRIAVGDVDGDHVPDIICAAGPGGGPNISVFSGLTGQRLAGPLGSFFAYDPRFTGGIFVGAGDVDGDGHADIVCGADAGGGPNITVFSGKDGNRLASFFAYDSRFTGGVRVAAGDVNGDGRAEVIAGAGRGGGPNVTIFDAFGTRLHSFFAYDPGFTAGIYVAAGDVNQDGKAEVVAGAGAGGGPNVSVLTADGVPVHSFFPFTPAFTGGVRVAAVARLGANTAIVAGAGPGGGPNVQTVDGLTLQLIDDFFAYDPRFSGGLYVAAG